MIKWGWAIYFCAFFLHPQIHGQDAILKVEVSSDTILHGNFIEVRFTMVNVERNFKPPQFLGFDLISGPNISSQFSMINGKVSQRASYTYYIQPIAEGKARITEGTVKSGNTNLSTEPIDIVVLPNPDGIIVRPRGFGIFQEIRVQDSSKVKIDSLKMKLKNLKTTKI